MPLDDVIVVAETGDTIYPGLVQTGEVLNGPEDAPAHVVVNAENSHALRMLTYTHAHSVDVIYIDPPYNTGAKDWKYNNDYVSTEDDYRHSKWLSFMQRRLDMAKQLLNPEDSVLIVTIDEKEVHRLGMLLEQTFPDARIQMVSSVIKPGGVSRKGYFSRSDEYIFFIMMGRKTPCPTKNVAGFGFKQSDQPEKPKDPLYWNTLWRSGSNARRVDRPDLFYPVFIDYTGRVIRAGTPLPLDGDRKIHVPSSDNEIIVWPIRKDGSEGRWQLSPDTLMLRAEKGYVKCGKIAGERTRLYNLSSGEINKVERGEILIDGHRADGSVIGRPISSSRDLVATSQWNVPSHDATRHGTILLSRFLPNTSFPFPKSLYAVEDVLWFFAKNNKEATVLDFFSGSGTTAHAVMRLNKQDGGRRRSISITNNEVSADEQKALRRRGLRPGDPEWEAMGICDYVTKPRVTAAITGKTPDGTPVKGTYKFTDEFDMADGFAANARFFTLTYESAAMVSQRLAFERVAPLLWLRAGQSGRVIDDLGDTGWDIADTYAVIENTDDLEDFLDALTVAVNTSEALNTVFVITDDDWMISEWIRTACTPAT